MNSSVETKLFFDKMATTWKNNKNEYNIREQITNMINLPRHSMIADIGCGKGVMFEHLLKTDPRQIFAIDISVEMLKCAKQLFNNNRIKYINEDLFSASLPMLDVALFFNAYPHFIDKRGVAKKLAQHVLPGGCVVIAHSCSKERINRVHSGNNVSKFSAPLRPADKEANEFMPLFLPESIIDNEEIYFIKMIRSKAELPA